ncbi:proline reductase-associated electron transfer protein PrdC [Sporolactobacillus shoreicorticis]|uniref:Proline reductase-associated electron transfer protein PrdC n=1 Tax=Sporolactobacillus shoreicorticis TaxID=1923877 RepID=A0ABW5RYT8_9BACL|nr:proline reductase-associated electron transfer protein PrdC [Sporolactobacillus shoreicorticis]MCO7127602.1 proline reductase-associated electron transfer protein PrdC [Sporolactobacillus shoreicorticis]
MLNGKYKLPLKQHIGNLNKPCVQEGDHVERGQCIARADGLGADLHASVSGTVVEVNAAYIAIIGAKPKGDTFVPLPPGDLRERIRSAGIVGMGGAGFPTGIKLSQEIDGGTVIANAAECEPILNHNVMQIEANPDEVYRGLLYAMEAVGAANGIIAIKAKHRQAIAQIKNVIRDKRITVFPLRDLYPIGEERALIRDTLGILLPPEARAITANTIIINTETLSRVTQAVEYGRPVLSKNITVAGKLHGSPKARVFMDVPIGTRVGDLIEASGGINGDYGEIIMDGPFMGHSVTADDVITKTTGGIIVTMPFLDAKSPLGLLVCACGASEARMRELAKKMRAEVAGVELCKHAVYARGSLKCRNPGVCPGQADRVLRLRKAGAGSLLIGNCSDCSNTVMSLAPKLNIPVHHVTDNAMRAMNLHLIRKLHR